MNKQTKPTQSTHSTKKSRLDKRNTSNNTHSKNTSTYLPDIVQKIKDWDDNTESEPEHERLGRICIKCGKRYIPTGKYQRICDECNKFTQSNKNLITWISNGEKKLKSKNFRDPRYIDIKKELKELNKIIKGILE